MEYIRRYVREYFEPSLYMLQGIPLSLDTGMSPHCKKPFGWYIVKEAHLEGLDMFGGPVRA